MRTTYAEDVDDDLEVVVHDDGILTITSSRPSRELVLFGEVDASTFDALAAALNGLDDDGDIHLDLSGLDFCDAIGFGTMVGLAQRVGPDHRVVLDGVPAPLCRLLAIVGWDSIANLTVNHRTG